MIGGLLLRRRALWLMMMLLLLLKGRIGTQGTLMKGRRFNLDMGV